MRILLLLLTLCGLPAFADQTPPVIDLTSALAAAEKMLNHQTEMGGDVFEALADHLLAEPKLTLPCFTFTLLMMVIIVALYRFGCSKTIIAVISLVTMCMWSFVLREDAIMRQVGNISFSLLIFMPLFSRLRNIFVNGRIIIASISDVVKGKKKKNPSRVEKKPHASSPTSNLIEKSKNRKKNSGRRAVHRSRINYSCPLPGYRMVSKCRESVRRIYHRSPGDCRHCSRRWL